MIVRKLRLQRGWSQAQLAELADVSTRTIQRIEGGQLPSVETSKALAAVFEVHFSTFRSNEEADMHDTTSETMTPEPTGPTDANTLTLEEQAALTRTKRLKAFYEGLLTYAVLLVVFGFFLYDKPGYYLLFGALGIWLVVQGLIAFERINLFSPGWEKRHVEKLLGRKL